MEARMEVDADIEPVVGSVMIKGCCVTLGIYDSPECRHGNPAKMPQYQRMFKKITFSEILILQRRYECDRFCLLFNTGGRLLGCGSEAARIYESLQGTFQYLLSGLFENVMNDSNLFNNQAGNDRLVVTATNGNTLPAEIVFAEYLHYMKRTWEPKPSDQMASVLWVLPVPATWNDAAKEMITVAAQKVGLNKGGNGFVVLSDSVVAALSVLEELYDTVSEVQQCYMLVNCLDDVTDISIQQFTQRLDGTILIEEIHNIRLAYGEDQVYKEVEAMLQKVFRFSDEYLKESCSLKQFRQSLLMSVWHAMVIEYNSLHGCVSDRTIRIELPKQIIEHAEKQNGKSVKELLLQCRDHSLEFLEKPMLRLDPATRKKFYAPLYYNLGRDIERVLHHPKCRLVTHVYLCGFLSGHKIAVGLVQQILPSCLQLKGCVNILPGDDMNVTRGTYFYKMLRKRLELRNLCNQPVQAICGTVFPDLVQELQQKNETLEQQVKQMREEFESLRQSYQETQQQSRLDKEELEQVTQKLVAQQKLFKQDNQQLRQEIEQQFDHVQQQFNAQSTQQVQEKKQLDRMGKQIEKLSQRLNQQSKQPPQTIERSRLVEGAIVINQIKHKNDTPTTKDLNRYVVNKQAVNWRDIGIELGLKLQVINNIE